MTSDYIKYTGNNVYNELDRLSLHAETLVRGTGCSGKTGCIKIYPFRTLSAGIFLKRPWDGWWKSMNKQFHHSNVLFDRKCFQRIFYDKDNKMSEINASWWIIDQWGYAFCFIVSRFSYGQLRRARMATHHSPNDRPLTISMTMSLLFVFNNHSFRSKWVGYI